MKGAIETKYRKSSRYPNPHGHDGVVFVRAGALADTLTRLQTGTHHEMECFLATAEGWARSTPFVVAAVLCAGMLARVECRRHSGGGMVFGACFYGSRRTLGESLSLRILTGLQVGHGLTGRCFRGRSRIADDHHESQAVLIVPI